VRSDILAVGTPVEVRCRFDRRWSHGFAIQEAVREPEGYRIRRRSDDSILPSIFTEAEVRPDRRRYDMWWAG